jgi:EAL domain-containing protein (putative c-di-GMP-specific phosphodiesterase class I)
LADRHYGLEVIVEGVETESQDAALLAAECHLNNGYLCRPNVTIPYGAVYPAAAQAVSVEP